MSKAKVVLTVLFVLCLISPLFTSASWTERQPYPIRTQEYDQVRGIGEDGTMYRTSGISTDVWIDRYNGSTWIPSGKCRGIQSKPIIIAPDQRHGFIVDTRIHHIRAISSPNGQDWTYGKVIAPELLFGFDFYSIACAWDTGDLYLAAEDYEFHFVKAPTYEEVREVKIQNCDLSDIGWASVNPKGTRLFIVMTRRGTNNKNIYECTGREENWGPPRRIGSISTNGWEHHPFAAKINSVSYLFFSGERENESSHYDIFYATEGTNPSVVPESLGKLKTLFR